MISVVKGPVLRVIRIKVAGGKLHVSPNSCKAFYHDQVKWQCNLPFFVFFGYVSPLNGKFYTKACPEGTVRYNAAHYGPRKFKYMVGVIKNGQFLIKDPDLDIQPAPPQG